MNQIDENKRLIERYPFLALYDRTGKPLDGYDYTWLDDMPDGWRTAFGEQMCEEIKDELLKFSYEDDTWLNHYKIVQIKEKYGALRWYDNGYPSGSKIPDIISKYETISETTCITCGKPAQYLSTGWISPYCRECAQEIVDGLNQAHGVQGTVESEFVKLGDFDEN